MPFKDSETRLVYQRKNKDKINEYRRKLYERKKKHFSDYNKIQHQKHREKRIESMKEYRMNNKPYLKEYDRIRDKKRRKYKNDQKTKWRKKYPRKALAAEVRYLKRYGKLFNMSAYQFKMALESWSNIINHRDKVCAVCGSSKQLEAHHILHKQYFPELSLNENNGTLLCIDHHKEIHA